MTQDKTFEEICEIYKLEPNKSFKDNICTIYYTWDLNDFQDFMTALQHQECDLHKGETFFDEN